MYDTLQAVRSVGEIFGGPCPPPGMDLMVTLINEIGYTLCFLPLHELQEWVDTCSFVFSFFLLCSGVEEEIHLLD